jgi:hypothetical protein
MSDVRLSGHHLSKSLLDLEFDQSLPPFMMFVALLVLIPFSTAILFVIEKVATPGFLED